MSDRDRDRRLMEFYGVNTLEFSEWPAEKNSQSDASEDEEKREKAGRRKSRYQVLERAVNRNSLVLGSEISDAGRANLVQGDESDPLGTTDSVLRTLRQMGVPLNDDPKLTLYLSQMHATADTQSLLQGLDVLSRSIDQKSASLKVLVESNFERFVRAKATIDNVYKEMKSRGAEPAPPRARAHSRHTSRNSFRSSGGGLALTSPVTPTADPRKKNALVKESEYGVMGVKVPLLDVSAKAEDVWGPALGGREKEEMLKMVASTLEKHKDAIDASWTIADSIRRKDYDTLVEVYNKARDFVHEATQAAQNAGSKLSEGQLRQIIIAGRMWFDVNEQVEGFKRDVWRRMVSINKVSKSESVAGQSQDQHMDLVALLLELGVEDNPMWMWLLSRYDHLKGKIQSTADRSRVEIEVLRRRLANTEKPGPQEFASHMKWLGRQSVEPKSMQHDSVDVIELWEKILEFVSRMVSTQGILGEVLELWRTVEGFLEGKIQRNLPAGYKGESQKHHRLSQQGSVDVQKGILELVDMIREQILAFFTGPPPEDLSLFLSPLQSPATPATAAISSSLSPGALRDARFNLDSNNLPPPSPKRGEAWEKFAFWPPWSNSVSGVQYLAKILALVGSGATEMASIPPVVQGDFAEVERLKAMVGAARERSVTALCAAWNRDAENIKFVEDWSRPVDRRDVTKMPASFKAFEGALLTDLQRILYMSGAVSGAVSDDISGGGSNPGAAEVVVAPQSKLQHMVRSQYVTTLYKALSGMVENAERSVKKSDGDWTADIDGYAHTGAGEGHLSVLGRASINAEDRNVRMLLTLSNLSCLRVEIVPELNSQFEAAFSVKLTDESKTIRDVLGQIDARLFQSYTRSSIECVQKMIRDGVTAPEWVPRSGEKPQEVRPYVYEALLNLVLVHSQVSTTASSLTNQVLSFLLERMSEELLAAFKTRPRYSLEALMQATLDVEFVAQTLSHYTNTAAGELQSAIYQELDSRTDNDARARLQAELPEMRAVLKRLREASRSEFACFRKPKRGGGQAVESIEGIRDVSSISSL